MLAFSFPVKCLMRYAYQAYNYRNRKVDKAFTLHPAKAVRTIAIFCC
ncbi:hypothetical protein ESCAB7627_0885 [Escherichia albertii TW07627]|uniref:Uncharacterized protein n=1 Tax=Escherichia albertii (strain TW07627) TaxID=502347 RepID=A0ABC9NU31_ESCAT|nr:hypothetical protein ESCAB7627_0885 [Escherichia albertii TW07627]